MRASDSLIRASERLMRASDSLIRTSESQFQSSDRVLSISDGFLQSSDGIIIFFGVLKMNPSSLNRLFRPNRESYNLISLQKPLFFSLKMPLFLP